MAFGLFLNMYNPNHIICGAFGKIYFYKFDNGYDKDSLKLKNEEIVWYELDDEEPHKVSIAIPISSFKLVHRWHEFNYQPDQKLWYVPEELHDGYYINEHDQKLQTLIVKDGATKRVRLFGGQYYIVSFYLKYRKYYNSLNKELLKKLFRNANDEIAKVNIEDILSSVRVESTEHFIYRHGDHDDEYYAKKQYSVKSKDPYINKFLPNKSETLAEDTGFCMAWDLKCYPDELLGRHKDEEEKLKEKFINNYSKEEHLVSILFDKLHRYLESNEQYNNNLLRLHEYFPCRMLKDELDYGPINRYEVEKFVLSKKKNK